MANKYGLDLDAAWRRVLAEVAHDDVPDVLEWQDFKLLWSEWKKEIESELDAGTYKPSDPGFVELPKDALLNRPLTLLRPKDRVVYEAIIDVLIPAIEGVLPDRVFSARVVEGKTGRRRMKNPVREWVRFAHAGRDHYKANPDVYMLSTDVTSYFE